MTQTAPQRRPPPNLLSKAENQAMEEFARHVWSRLQSNDLGGYSGVNRPLYLLWMFKDAIEKWGNRDVGLSWSKEQLEAINVEA